MHILAFVCVVLAIVATFASHTLKRPVRSLLDLVEQKVFSLCCA